MKTYLTIIVLSITGFTGCVSVSELSGFYELREFEYVGISLYEDQTYSYRLSGDLCSDTVFHGSWKKHLNTILLTNPHNEIVNPSKIYESKKSYKEKTIFTVSLHDTIPWYPLKIFLNDGEDTVHIKNGRGEINQNYRIKKFQIFGPLIDITYKVKYNNSNDFEIELYFDQLAPCDKRQIDTTLRYRKGCLYSKIRNYKQIGICKRTITDIKTD